MITPNLFELALGYGFVLALFVGLPAALFIVIFLPGLMRTTGEGIGRMEAQSPQDRAVSLRVSFRKPAAANPVPTTMMNTA